MKFSEQWLREWVNPTITTQQLSDQLTMAGLEVEAIEPVCGSFDKVVVGQVTRLEKHPDADKLQVCRVDVGQSPVLQIVCGARNVSEGGKYPVALVGAQLPNDLVIKKSKLRGVESLGMLCSAKELGLAEQAEGLMTLPESATVGQSVRDLLQLDDHSIELSLTPNRGDCLCVAGVAREVAVLNKIKQTPVHIEPVTAQSSETFSVDITAREECPRYVGRVIRDINPKATTPLWLQERLRRSGLRSISPVVDVTNYVLLELGQPMHGFDLEKLNGGIRVRLSELNESITLLDGQTVELQPGSLIIADHQHPQALAGIMGGQASAVSDSTQHIFLESAYFSPLAIAGRARLYGLHTDSSHRFERGVAPDLQERAIERATTLLLDIVGGVPGPVIEQSHADFLPQRATIFLRYERLQKILGVEVEKSACNDILYRLEMEHVEQEHGWSVTPPSFRFDIEREEDLIEEIARIYGYSNIPIAPVLAPAAMLPMVESHLKLERIQDCLIERGYQEAITYSFVDPKLQQLLYPGSAGVALTNPISSDMSEMRLSLWPGLVSALAYNLNRQQSQVRLFETGLRFQGALKELKQEPMLAGICSGSAVTQQWGEKMRNLDFFDVKSDVEGILALTGNADGIMFVADKHPALHPGQSAKITRQIQRNHQDADNKSEELEEIGWIGALHPAIVNQLDLAQPAFVFELKLDAVLQRKIPHFEEIPKYPSIKRDLAIVIDANISAQKVSDCIRRISTVNLTNLKLFDVYQGKGIDPGSKSLAYSLTLQDNNRTLTDADVDQIIDEILSNLRRDLGGTLRN